MDRSRPVLALVMAAALIAVGLPTTAHAADLPVVNSACSDVDGDYGTLLVSITAPAGVASITAEIVTWSTGDQVAVTDEFVLRSGTVTNGVWATAQPLVLAELGTYRVHVEVTDTNGNLVRRNNAGDLFYAVVTFFDGVTTDRDTVTYDQRQVTLTGTLYGRFPGTGEIRPLAGFPMYVTTHWDWDTVTTAADGTFAGTVSIEHAGQRVYAEYVYDNNHVLYLSSRSDGNAISVTPRPTRISISATPRSVDQGATITLTGRLAWKTSDGWQPVPGAQVGVLFCHGDEQCFTSVGYPVTDADGRYQITAAPFQTGYYQVGYAAVDPESGNTDPFVSSPTATTDVVVWQPASFREFSAHREDGTVVVQGRYEFGNFTPIDIPTEIQFSKTGTGKWKTVTTVNAGGSESFFVELDWPTPGYWRAYYPGMKDWYRPVTSTPVLVS